MLPLETAKSWLHKKKFSLIFGHQGLVVHAHYFRFYRYKYMILQIR